MKIHIPFSTVTCEYELCFNRFNQFSKLVSSPVLVIIRASSFSSPVRSNSCFSAFSDFFWESRFVPQSNSIQDMIICPYGCWLYGGSRYTISGMLPRISERLPASSPASWRVTRFSLRLSYVMGF